MNLPVYKLIDNQIRVITWDHNSVIFFPRQSMEIIPDMKIHTYITSEHIKMNLKTSVTYHLFFNKCLSKFPLYGNFANEYFWSYHFHYFDQTLIADWRDSPEEHWQINDQFTGSHAHKQNSRNNGDSPTYRRISQPINIP